MTMEEIAEEVGRQLAVGLTVLQRGAQEGFGRWTFEDAQGLAHLAQLLIEAGRGGTVGGMAVAEEGEREMYVRLCQTPGWSWPVERERDLAGWLQMAGVDTGLAALGHFPSRERAREIATFCKHFFMSWLSDELGAPPRADL